MAAATTTITFRHRKPAPNLDLYRERFGRTLDQLNLGEFDEVLGHYAENVTVLNPSSRPGDPVRETMIYGRAGLRQCLLRFTAASAPLRLLDVAVDQFGEITAFIAGREGAKYTWRIAMNPEGLGRRVVVSLD